jgi:hypothetical protein
MPDDILPGKISRLDVLRVEYGKRKFCECLHPHYEIDVQNHIVTCKDCGAIIDPFEVLVRISRDDSDWNKQNEMLLKERQELLSWKPRLVLARQFVERYASGHGRNSMVPRCPNCGKPFDLPIINWCNRAFLKRG